MRNNVRTQIWLLIMVIVLAVNCHKTPQKFTDYFYDKEEQQVYFFDNSKVTIFNFNDSIRSKVIFVIEGNNIRIGDEVYNFYKANDTLNLFNSSSEGVNLNLVRFNFKLFDLKKIHLKSFEIEVEREDRETKQFYNEEQFLIGDRKGGFYTFYSNKNTVDTLYRSYISFKGLFFDKFPFYEGASGTKLIICNYKRNRIQFLSLLNGEIVALRPFKFLNGLDRLWIEKDTIKL